MYISNAIQVVPVMGKETQESGGEKLLSKNLISAGQRMEGLSQIGTSEKNTGSKRLRLNEVLATPLKFSNMQHPPTMHTMEYQGEILHDTNFNNKQKVKIESLNAVYILKNPDLCAKTVEKLSSKLFDLISNANEKNGFEKKFIDFIEKDSGTAGQFGRIENGKSGVLDALGGDFTSTSLVKKVLVIKSVGAFIIDHASKSPSDYDFLPVGDKTNSIIEKNKPAELFEVRGRTGIKSKESREDIGILDKKEFELLSAKEKDSLKIEGLQKERPLFRTVTHEIGASGKRDLESAFVNRTFDKDAPLVASISGSTACIFVCADSLMPIMSKSERKEIAIAAVGFIVGGGYHSTTEVLDVAYPGLDLNRELDMHRAKNGGL